MSSGLLHCLKFFVRLNFCCKQELRTLGYVGSLSEGIANICCLLNPEVIVLGGGIMAQQAYLRPRIMQRVEELVVPAMRVNTRLAFAELGNDAGMIGALYSLLHSKNA